MLSFEILGYPFRFIIFPFYIHFSGKQEHGFGGINGGLQRAEE